MALVVSISLIVIPSWILTFHLCVLFLFRRLRKAGVSKEAYADYLSGRRQLKKLIDFFDWGETYSTERRFGETTVFVIKLCMFLAVAPVVVLITPDVPIEGYSFCTSLLLISAILIALFLYVQQAKMTDQLKLSSHDRSS